MASNSGCRFSPGVVQISRRRAWLGVGVKHRKVELVFAGIQIDEQIVDFVQHFLGARVGTIDFVDDHDRRQLGFQRLAQHVAGLRQRAFAGIHQQHHAVDHLQRALHFAAEIAVARRVHDVDLGVVVENRRVLGQDGDAALALQFIGIHHPLDEVSLARKMPLWFSMASTSVVLPWSTWAMMAILRMLVLKTVLSSLRKTLGKTAFDQRNGGSRDRNY